MPAYPNRLAVVFDEQKNRENIRKHGIDLAKAVDFDLDTAVTYEDQSQDYGEVRLISVGFLHALMHVLVYTEIGMDRIRAISLRAADSSERKDYADFF